MKEDILKDFITPLERIANERTLLERVKDLEGYYRNFCKRFAGREESVFLKEYESFFAGIDGKPTDEKMKIINIILSYTQENEISMEELSLMEGFLETPIAAYKGVGTKNFALLKEKGIEKVRDILFYLPYNYIDKRKVVKIAQLKQGERAYLKIKLLSISPWRQRGLLSKRGEGLIATATDGTGYVTLKWFYQPPKFVRDLLKINQDLYVFGRVEYFRGTKEIHHPEVEAVKDVDEQNSVERKVLPLYFGLPAGISDKVYRKVVYEIVCKARDLLKCLLPETLKRRLKLLEWGEALYQLHFPEDYDEKLFSERRSQYHLSLIYQELFLFFALLLTKGAVKEWQKTEPLEIGDEKSDAVIKSLGYELTNAQKRVLKEIREDLKKPVPMQRLLQGDVGSGKTVVALLAAMMVIEAGKQVVVMAPTEILATQHYLNFKNFAEISGVEPVLLVSAMKKKEYQEALEKIKSGEAKLVVGTHALIQENVIFKELGLAIIDEQHRFGVNQRQELIKKGLMPHVLYMTATPIPRTLTMTVYGDLNVSIIDEMPSGRKPVKTAVLPELQRERAFLAIEEELKKGGQAYVVYPVIDEDNALELKAATQMYEIIKERFIEYKVALLHGRMTAEEKEAVMNEFKAGKTAILVSTTVVEVGVDVPNAAIMVIEHGERFGLSSLHQLRGRIGRGKKEARCIVLVDTKRLGEKARERLLFFRDTTDGFKLAEFDLKLRGPGEILGTKQSGLPEFSFIDLIADTPLIEMMKKLTEDYLKSTSPDCLYRKRLAYILKLYFSKNLEYSNVA
ncbi:MAG: ATP-dependent DNA helicase RecG [bacterium]